MSGYVELNRTGFAPFDNALSLIEDAGTAYHHTSRWIEDGWNGEKPYLDQINESIVFAAKSYLNLQEQIIELTRQRDLAVEAIRHCIAAMGSVTDVKKAMNWQQLHNAQMLSLQALDVIKESEEN